VTDFDFTENALSYANNCVEDWVFFAKNTFGIYLDEEQESILRSVQYNRKTSVRSGTARGKDFISAVAAMCFFYLTPKWDENGVMVENTKVALTAPTDRQVGNIMFPEISKLFNAARRNGVALPGRLVGYDIRTENEEWFLTGFKADSTNTESWTGFHAPNTMFVVTEASGIPELVFNAIEGNLQGNSRLLIVFNDNTGTGYAANSQRSPSWAKFRLDSLNAPNVKARKVIVPGQVDWEWVNSRVCEWCIKIDPSEFQESEGDFIWTNEDGVESTYRPNDLFRVKVRGMAPKVSSDALIPEDWIRIANKNWQSIALNPGLKANHQLRLGVDVAGMGRDNSVFCLRFGNYVQQFQSMNGAGTANQMEIAGKAASYIKQFTDHERGMHAKTFVDTIGEGAGVFSRLNELYSDHIYSVKFSNKPEMEGRELTDITGQYKFVNMKAFLFWALRDWLNPESKNNAAIPPDDELLQELTEMRWKFRSDGKIQIESKEDLKARLKRSPDKSDALANTFYPVIDFNLKTERQRKQAITQLAAMLR
jgi:hypothetical protein